MALIYFCYLFFLLGPLILLFGCVASFVFYSRNRVEDSCQIDELHQEFDLTELFMSLRNHGHSMEEKEESSLVFRFCYQISAHTFQKVNNPEPGAKSPPVASMKKCNFLFEKDFGGFMKEPEDKIYCVLDSYFYSHGKEALITEDDSRFLSDKDCQMPSAESGKDHALQVFEELLEISDEEEHSTSNETRLVNELVGGHGGNVLSEKSSGHVSDSDSSDGYSVHELVVDSDGFLSERDFDRNEPEEDTAHNSASTMSNGIEFEGVSRLRILHLETEASESNSCSLRSELIRLSQEEAAESSEVHDSQETDLQVLSIDKEHSEGKSDFPTDKLSGSTPISNDVNLANRDLDLQVHNLETAQQLPDWGEAKYEQEQLMDSGGVGYDELESLWEHQELIEQLRMELRKLRDIGLPTILEDSTETVEDLKPLKIDEIILHEDSLVGLHKSYRSYREKMRKFDILNHQKLYAVGFLQLKDPLQSVGSQRALVHAIQSIFLQSFSSIFRKPNANQSEKLLRDLRSNLEMVYVGQMCLSWEFLRWQYEKARELPESDTFRSNCYHKVAGEFQQFQVIIQRFIENEAFQGPRLPNYIKNRCVLRNLLQVPLIREDHFKDKMEDQHKGISSEMLEDIMEESIRTFWEFVKADKDETPRILKGFMAALVELQDPSDADLKQDIQSDLNKKEKRLKDIIRTGNCLVKKLKKPKEGRSNQDMFFTQVDLKLVARVLRMTRITTEQLVWCQNKLSKIGFSERMVIREPSFLLFPC